MAVVAKWMCDRDNSMFDSKKDADAYDKMLELGEQFSELLHHHIPDVDETKAEEFGIFLARNKDLLAQACKGRPEVLNELISGDNNIHQLAKEA